jgi:hypothetical protein
MQAMNTYADGGVVPLVPKLCTRWTWAASLSACFASGEECHNPVNKTLAGLHKRYVLRKTSYLTTGENHFLSNPLKFLQTDHQLTYFSHCIYTADDKILVQVSITLYMIFELEFEKKKNDVSQNDGKFHTKILYILYIILLVHFYIFERNMHMREFFGH